MSDIKNVISNEVFEEMKSRWKLDAVDDVMIKETIKLTLQKTTDGGLICNECGFPKDMERVPVILNNDVLSFLDYDANVCDGCGHQKDGSTIKPVYDFWQDLVRELIKNKEEEKNKIFEILPEIIDKYLTKNYGDELGTGEIFSIKEGVTRKLKGEFK